MTSTTGLITVLFVLFLGGLLLLLAEIFIIPGFGIAGIGGIAALSASVVYAFMNLSLQGAILFTFIALILSAIVVVMALKILPKTALGKSLILSTEQRGEGGYDASSQISFNALLGNKGTVSTPLRPSGSAMIEGKKYDVVSDGAFIEKGKEIVVTKVEGNRILVDLVENAPQISSADNVESAGNSESAENHLVGQ